MLQKIIRVHTVHSIHKRQHTLLYGSCAYKRVGVGHLLSIKRIKLTVDDERFSLIYPGVKHVMRIRSKRRIRSKIGPKKAERLDNIV